MNMAIEHKGFHGAKLALIVGDKLAVILRDDKPSIPSPNHWDMPGGGREGCETPLECVLRETHEELNIHVDPAAVVWGKRFPYPDGDRWFFVAYVDEAVANTIRLGDEGQTWGLKSPEEYAGLPNNIVRFSDRLKMYLSGIEDDFFESPPRSMSEGS
jgi:8-oxo-dGTP diphosphatase